MATQTQTSVVQLVEQLSEGFAALSEEYQLLFSHQKQLESKLTWAKQQVCGILFFCFYSYDEHFSSRPAAAQRL